MNIPYNSHLGIEYRAAAEGKSVVVLPDRPELKNHIGSQHAGALFSVAEAASGTAMFSAFASVLGSVTPLVKHAGIKFSKVARGPITAKGEVTEDKDKVLARLAANGRAEFEVNVTLTDDEGTTVATTVVQWYLRSNSQ